MIGQLLAAGANKMKELGLGNFAENGAETGSSPRITRQYMDSLTIEVRAIDTAITTKIEVVTFIVVTILEESCLL